MGHTILVIVYHMLKNQQPYRDLGSDYFDRRNSEQLKWSLIRRLEGLGLQVSVKSQNQPEEKMISEGEPSKSPRSKTSLNLL